MKKEHIEDILKSYERLRKENAHMRYPLSFAEHMAELEKTYNRLLSKHTVDKQIKFLLTTESNDKGFRLYEAFVQNDMEMLNNILFEIAHLSQVGNISSPGTDHAYYSYNIMPELMAANMTDRISLILPEENGMSNSNTIGGAIVNLFMAIWYQNEEYQHSALSEAEKKIKTNLTQYDRAYISYLIAILRKDVEEASEQLEKMCEGHRKSKQFGVNDFNKKFALGVHGMYNLSHYVYNGELREKVRMPEADNFCQDLSIWQQKNGNRQGKAIHNYSKPIDIMNTIMMIQPPTMHLYKKTPKKVYLNTDLFEKEILQLVKEKAGVV